MIVSIRRILIVSELGIVLTVTDLRMATHVGMMTILEMLTVL